MSGRVPVLVAAVATCEVLGAGGMATAAPVGGVIGQTAPQALSDFELGNLFNLADRGGRGGGEERGGGKRGGDKDQGDKDQGDKDQGDKDQGDKDQGDKDQGDKQQGDKQQGDKQQGDKQQGDKQQGDKQQGDKQDKAANGGGAQNAAVTNFNAADFAAADFAAAGLNVPGMVAMGLVPQGAAFPGMALPGMAVPGMAVPGTAVPGTALPGMAIPGVADAANPAFPGLVAMGTAPATNAPGVAPEDAAPGAGQQRAANQGVADKAMANQVMKMVNQERVKVGCPALQLDPQLQQAAQTYAQDMADSGRFSHTSADGTTFVQRAKAAGYANPGAENISKGNQSAQAIMDAFMNSPGHAKNILNCDFTALGVGVAQAPDGQLLVAQEFGRPV
jgi:uncharacterized protein YkwD